MSERNGNRKQNQQQSISSPSPGLLDRLFTPMTDVPSRFGRELSNRMTTPRLDEGKLSAMIRGGMGGMVEGAGNLASDMTSPFSLMSMLSGGVGNAMRPFAQGTSAISKAIRPTIDIVEAIPKRQVMPTVEDVAALTGDLERNLARIPNSRNRLGNAVRPRIY